VEITNQKRHQLLSEKTKELKSQSWISVSTQLPEHDHSVLVYTSDDTILMDRFYPDQQKWSEAKMWGYRITHWMPLPDLPRG
jgi:acyl-CoA thioesterase